jgi:diguanylate cyclase (GGDEF)-like protein
VLTIEDDLTGCLNRNKIEEDLEAKTNRVRRYGRPLSLLMIDIDWFKSYNDFHGQANEDELLKKLSGIITHNLRNTDRVYWYGGEEFVVLLPETNKENALIAAERLRETIEQE